MEFEVEVRVNPIFDRGSEIVRDELDAAMVWGVNELRNEINPRTPVGVTGNLKAGNQIELGGTPIDLVGRVYNNLPYNLPAELGTPPHPVSVQGRGSLALWVRRKLGVSDERELRSVVFLIARKIAREGTKGANMFRDGAAAAKGRIQGRFAEVPGRIVRRLGGS